MNFNKLTPTFFNIANLDPVADHKLDVAESMLFQCVSEGDPRYQGADGPEGFAPDYADLKAEYDADPGAANAAYNAWRHRHQRNYKALTDLWKVRDCAAMVALMEAAEAQEIADTESEDKAE